MRHFRQVGLALIPEGSRLLELRQVRELVDELDEVALVYPWQHPNPRVDRLCQDVLAAVQEGQKCCESRREIFSRVWELAQEACELGALDGLERFSAAL